MIAFRPALGAVVAVVLVAFRAAAGALPPAESTRLFLEQCSGCHSIGGGVLQGPDLIAAARYPPQQIRDSLTRMQDYVGALQPDQVEGLVALLRDPSAKDRVAGKFTEPPVVTEHGSAKNGRRLFFGEQRFKNGGVSCFACHTAEARGGNLAVDLTKVHARIGNAGVLAASERPGFPLMKGAYARHPVAHDEALDVAAFLEESAAGKQGVQARSESATVHGAATGVAVMVFATVSIVFRPRRNGERSRTSRR